MTDAGLAFLLQKIDNLLSNELDLPEKIESGVPSLKGELEKIKRFLNKADVRGANVDEEEVKSAIRDFRVLSHEIEDVLDRHALLKVRPHRRWYSPDLHSLHRDIEKINNKQKELEKRYPWLFSSSSHHAASPPLEQPHSPLVMDAEEVVGFEETKKKLIKWGLRHEGGEMCRRVMFITGMGASGKTSVAKYVYENIKTGFDCVAWIKLSKHKSKPTEPIRNLLNKLKSPDSHNVSEPSLPPDEEDTTLMKKLQDHLTNKKYLIVLDNLHKKDDWEVVKRALPKKGASGRVIITTRRKDIASSCIDSSYVDVHDIRLLTMEEAQELFNKQCFTCTKSCPPRLVDWSKKILSKCGRLPLAIAEAGTSLSTRERSESEWKGLHDSIEAELKTNGRLSKTMAALSSNYEDLPLHLKDCFLYMSIFPEGYPIKRRRLVRLWLAEGYIKEERGKQLEDIGEEYLKELIDRNLVLASEVDFDGRPRYCSLHSLMHTVNLSKLQDENFCQSTDGNWDEKARRMVIHESTTGVKISKLHRICARAVFMLSTQETAPHGPVPKIKYSRLILLKILHIEGINLDKFPDEISELLLLKYLCLSNTNIKSIPESIRKLQLLETLDLKQTLVTELPEKLTELARLRHLLVYSYNIGPHLAFDAVKGFTISEKLSRLSNLQKLSFVKAKGHDMMIQEIGKLTQLRKLGIIELANEDGPMLCRAIESLENLRSLNVTSSKLGEYLDLHYINITKIPRLRRLYLKGSLKEMPVWVSKLNDLLRIRLKWSRLTDQHNPLEVLQDLPNLLELQLLDAYTGNQLDFYPGKFPRLEILEFEQLQELQMVIMERNTLPSLKKLIIRRCEKLVHVPVGIQGLSRLKELHLPDMPQKFVAEHRNGGRYYDLIRNIPRVYPLFQQYAYRAAENLS